MPADPKFGRLARQIKKVIKIVHHLQNVTEDSDKPQPRMISRMVEILANMVKPAAPNSKTMDLIVGNAKNWGHTSLIILQDHYEAALEEALQDLTPDPGLNWREAFEVATRWARRNLPRLPRDVVEHAEALVTAVMVSDKQGPQKNKDPNPQEGGQGRESILGLTRRRGMREDSSQVRFEEVTMSQQQTNQQREEQQVRRPNTRDGSSQVEPPDGLLVPHPPRQAPPEREEQTRIVGHQQVQTEETPFTTRQKQVRGNPPEIEVLEEGVSVESLAPAPQQPPKERRVPRQNQSQMLVGERGQLQGDQVSSLVPPRTITVEAQVLRDPFQEDSLLEGDLVDLGETAEDAGNSLTSAPQLPPFGPTRHIRTDRKMVDWTLSVSKKWLIVGDSNLSRLPHHDCVHLQIDSYPGANFRHLGQVLDKAVVQLLVEKVVICGGISSRGQKVKETTVKQLQNALRTAKKRFPYAEIWIPLVNYSTNLPVQEQRNLIKLNAHIYKNMPYIPQLPDASFHTDQDNIHWTRETGKAMLEHWTRFLNL